MQKLSALSNKIKVLILVFYTLILLGLSIFIVNKGTATKELSGYSIKTYDEYVNLTVRVYEERNTAVENKGENDSTQYKIRAFLEKKDAAKGREIKNIRYYVTGINRKGKYIFDEPSTSATWKISKSSSFANTGSSSIIANKVFIQTITIDGSTKETTKTDNQPVKLFIKTTYEIILDDETVRRTISSEIKLSDIQKEDFSKYTETTLEENTLKNDSEALDFEVEVNRAKEESTSDKASKDTFDFEASLNAANLGDKTIERFSIEAFGKLESEKPETDKMFSQYVRLYTLYGSTLTRTGTTLQLKIDESYNVKELYIKTIVTFTDGTSSRRLSKIILN